MMTGTNTACIKRMHAAGTTLQVSQATDLGPCLPAGTTLQVSQATELGPCFPQIWLWVLEALVG